MWELHPTRPNQYARHWFEIEQAKDRGVKPLFWTPLSTCEDQACNFWSTCYDCNDCPATLLVDKAEFIARKELELECNPKQEPPNQNLPPIHPNAPFYYSHLTDPDDFNDPERMKDAKWRASKSLRISQIALALAWKGPDKPKAHARNKEDLATVEQVRKELDYRRYHNHKHIKTTTTPPEYQNDENRPVNKNKRDPDTQQHTNRTKMRKEIHWKT
jgi:hypothetical protein